MLGEKPGKRHDAELRLKEYLGKTLHLKQPQEAAREVFGQSPGGPPHFSGARFRSGTGLAAIHLTIRYSQAIPISAYPDPGIRPSVAPWFRSFSDKRSDFTENQCTVCAAETKRVRHRHVNFHFSGGICHIVQVTMGILVENIDSGR